MFDYGGNYLSFYVCMLLVTRCCVYISALRSAEISSSSVSDKNHNETLCCIRMLIFHIVSSNKAVFKDRSNHRSHFAVGSCERLKGLSHRQLQQFVQRPVVFALDEGIGAAGLGYSYPGQSGFLGVGRRGGHRIRQGGQETREND